MEWLLIILLVALYYLIGFLLAFYTADNTLERVVYFVAFVTGGFAGFACAAFDSRLKKASALQTRACLGSGDIFGVYCPIWLAVFARLLADL